MRKNALSLVAATLCAVSAYAVSDHSITEFPRLTGETDDTPRFQRAVDACYGGGLLSVPGGNYALARTVFVTNLCSIEMSPGARIKAVAEMDWMFKINQMWQYSPKTAPKDVEGEIYNLTFRGGTLDADGKASCLAIDNYRHFTLENATFLNGRRYGVGIELEGRGYEMIARNLYFKTLIHGLAGNTALFTNGGDSHYTDIVVVDYTTGFHVFGGGANWLTRVHVWGGPVKPPRPGELPEMLKDSVCFRIGGSGTHLQDCYADTGAIGYWITGWETQMSGCIYFNNVGFGLKDVTIIRQDSGTLWCERCCLRSNTPETKLYAGTSKAKVHWGANNIYPGFWKAPARPMPLTVDLSSPPICIDKGRQLFLDDDLVTKGTMKRIWHRPVRNGRPVASVSLAGGVWYDGAAKRYRGWTDDGSSVMESINGVSWKPVAGGAPLRADRVRVAVDYEALDGKRFKVFAGLAGKSGCVAMSADGLSWSEPVRTVAAGDLAMVYHNPFTRYWGYSFRESGVKGNPVASDYHEADNFLAGAKFRPSAHGARYKPVPTPWVREAKPLRGKTAADVGEFGCVAYEGVLIGLAQVADGKDAAKGTDIWLGFAIDRWHWTFPKPTEGEAFISQTRRVGDWDASALTPVPGGCTVNGDELRFYYSGAKQATGYARLRRDGFCSVQDGEIRTKPLVFSKGDRLWVNADVRQGELTVRVEGQDGQNFGTKKISDANSTRLEVGALEANKPFTLVFTSTGGAKLYSFWSGGADGRSGGYLAGGSPESATFRDEADKGDSGN